MNEEKSCFIIAALAAFGAAILTAGIGYGAHQRVLADAIAEVETRHALSVENAVGTWDKLKRTLSPASTTEEPGQ